MSRAAASRLAASLLVASLGSVLACRGAPPASPPVVTHEVTAPPPVARAEGPFRERCVADCERRRAMQAVGAEMIRAECEDFCLDEWALPVVARKKDLVQQDAFRVRLVGTLVEGAGGSPAVELIGGATVLLDPVAGGARGALPAWGRPVVVAGTLILGAGPPRLESWTTLIER